MSIPPLLKQALTLTLIWRICLFCLALSASFFFKYAPTFPYSAELLRTGLEPWLFSWANFDGVHYLRIITKGYESAALIQAFFPAFPLVIKLLLVVLQIKVSQLTVIIAALLVNFGLVSALLVLLFMLVQIDYSETVARNSLVVLLLFPTSFFLAAVYSEALFLFVVLGAFLAVRKERWWWALPLIAIASATRVVGVLLLPALLVELWLQATKSHTLIDVLRRATHWQQDLQHLLSKYWKPILGITLASVTGIGAYMLYLQQTFGDPLFFYHVQAEFGGGRQESLILYPQVLWRSIKILLNSDLNIRYFTSVLEFLAGAVGLVGLLLALKKVRLSYVVFSLAAFIVPTLTGTFSSMPRYILICFALLIWVALQLEHYPRLKIPIAIISGIVLSVSTILFIQGYWVA